MLCDDNIVDVNVVKMAILNPQYERCTFRKVTGNGYDLKETIGSGQKITSKTGQI